MNKKVEEDSDKMNTVTNPSAPIALTAASQSKVTLSSSTGQIEKLQSTKSNDPNLQQPGTGTGSKEEGTPKRKRKSPDKPWKKPPDMPRRPLSAYNLFFRAERERIVGPVLGSGSKGGTSSTGSGGSSTPIDDPLLAELSRVAAAAEGSGEEESQLGQSGHSLDNSKPGTTRRRPSAGKKSGVGFAGLAKKIAAKWNFLSDEEKAPYEEIAAADKKRYDDAVAAWRVVQKQKKKEAAAAAAAATVAAGSTTITAANQYEYEATTSEQVLSGDDTIPLPLNPTYGHGTGSATKSFLPAHAHAHAGVGMDHQEGLSHHGGTSGRGVDVHYDDTFSQQTDSYPDEWFEASIDPDMSERSASMHPVYEDSSIREDQPHQVNYFSHHNTLTRGSNLASFSQSQQDYGFTNDPMSLYPATFAESFTSLQPLRTQQNAHELYFEQQQQQQQQQQQLARRNQELELERLNSLRQYNEYMQQQDEQQRDQHRRQELHVRHQQQMERQLQGEQQMQQEMQGPSQRQAMLRPTGVARAAGTRSRNRTQQYATRPGRQQYAAAASFRSNPGQLPQRANEPRTPGTQQQQADAESVCSPLTPLFGLAMEDQMSEEKRGDRPFLYDAMGNQLPPDLGYATAAAAASATSVRRQSGGSLTLPSPAELGTSSTQQQMHSDMNRGLSSSLRPRPTMNMFRQFPGGDDTVVTDVLDRQQGTGMMMYYGDAYNMSLASASRGGRQPLLAHRSASLPLLAISNTLQPNLRDNDGHRRYSASGPTTDYRQVDHTTLQTTSHAQQMYGGRYTGQGQTYYRLNDTSIPSANTNVPMQGRSSGLERAAYAVQMNESYTHNNMRQPTTQGLIWTSGDGGISSEFEPETPQMHVTSLQHQHQQLHSHQQQQQQHQQHPTQDDDVLTPDANLTASIQTLSAKLDDEAVAFLTSINKSTK